MFRHLAFCPDAWRPTCTEILLALEQGDSQAADDLLPLVYEELRRLAAQRLARKPPGLTLQATALVHEAYVRLVDRDEPQTWASRGHFFAAAAEAMRRILVEDARRKQSLKRGGHLKRVHVDPDELASQQRNEELLALEEALTKLAEKDARAAKLVELRYFAGLTLEQAAEVLDVSLGTVKKDWTYARTWLRRQMTEGGACVE